MEAPGRTAGSAIGQRRVVGILQARMGSARLPGKTLAQVEGRPVLAWILDRVRASKALETVVVATTARPEDEAILQTAAAAGVSVYAGDPDDVLDRFYHAAMQAGADVIVRLTADNPFQDPDVIDRVTRALVAGVDYASNTLEPTYPDGLEAEAFTFDALARAWRDATLQFEREHVTPYIKKNPQLFRLENIRHECDLSQFRWTLDYEEDLRFTREIYARLASRGTFRMGDMLELLKREPSLISINAGIPGGVN